MVSMAELEQQYYAAMLGLEGPPYPSTLQMQRAFYMGVYTGEITFGGTVDPGELEAAIAAYFVENPVTEFNRDVPLDASDDYATYITINDDGTATAGWPDRARFVFNPQSGGDVQTFWNNEYGEARGTPAKSNTVAARWFVGTDPTAFAARDLEVPVLEISSDRTNRETLFAVYGDGTVSAKNVSARVEVHPTGTSVPVGTPDFTLWAEYDV